jgi:rod shape-determining protein MreC
MSRRIITGLLKKELGFFEADTTEEFVPARIVGREPVSFLDYIIVDRGKDNGLANGMAVISGGVLVGQVSEVYEKTARITLITSKDSIIQAMLQNSRSKGVLKGGISGLVLENVTQDIDYAKGEDVVTSGLGGELKEGILIGKAGDSRSPSSGIFKDISIEPIADFSKLEVVFIVKR